MQSSKVSPMLKMVQCCPAMLRRRIRGLSEGWPNVVLEALACGRAVVATGVGGTAALVEDQKTGFVVPRGDDAALVELMATLLADRELCGAWDRLVASKQNTSLA